MCPIRITSMGMFFLADAGMSGRVSSVGESNSNNDFVGQRKRKGNNNVFLKNPMIALKVSFSLGKTPARTDRD